MSKADADFGFDIDGAKEVQEKYLDNPTPADVISRDVAVPADWNCFAELPPPEGIPGEIFPCKVLAVRPRGMEWEIDPNATYKPGDKFEYHVHYDHLDRRMDKWVTRDMVVFWEELSPDEQTHVQLGLAQLAQQIREQNPNQGSSGDRKNKQPTGGRGRNAQKQKAAAAAATAAATATATATAAEEETTAAKRKHEQHKSKSAKSAKSASSSSKGIAAAAGSVDDDGLMPSLESELDLGGGEGGSHSASAAASRASSPSALRPRSSTSVFGDDVEAPLMGGSGSSSARDDDDDDAAAGNQVPILDFESGAGGALLSPLASSRARSKLGDEMDEDGNMIDAGDDEAKADQDEEDEDNEDGDDADENEDDEENSDDDEDNEDEDEDDEDDDGDSSSKRKHRKEQKRTGSSSSGKGGKGGKDTSATEAEEQDAAAAAADSNRVGRLGSYQLLIPEPHDHLHEQYDKMMAIMVRNVDSIVIGKFDMEAWYFSPFPIAEDKFNRRLYFCEFCLSFFGHDSELRRHMRKCNIRHPPGPEIYRSQEQNVTIAVFEVDGRKERVYCENLCYISKLFLDHKYVKYDTSPFHFYVLTEVDEQGCHFVAYFSKEKKCECIPGCVHNLNCILTLPCHQKKGYGRFIISLSYELSKIENKVGTPEAPISDLGQISYDSYWKDTLIDLLRRKSDTGTAAISIQELSNLTKMNREDIQRTLVEKLKLIRRHAGDHEYKIDLSPKTLEKFLVKKMIDPNSVFVSGCDPKKLHWTPVIL